MNVLGHDRIPNVVIDCDAYKVTVKPSRLLDSCKNISTMLPNLFTKLRSWEANGDALVTIKLLEAYPVIWCNGKQYKMTYDNNYLMWLRVLNVAIKLTG